MAPVRQVEAADLMIGQKAFTTKFATAILAATPDAMLVDPRRRKPDRKASAEQIGRMERELGRLQLQVKSIEETYGIDNLHLTAPGATSGSSSGMPGWCAGCRSIARST
jgi:hypothetical protein